MHLVLQSTDILPTIFAHLDQTDIARALRVCRLWNQWSDILWSSLPALTPMLNLLFPFLFTDADDKYVRGVPLYQMDRQRLFRLNQTIRHLDASFSSSKSLFDGYNPDIPRLLLDLCEPDTALFPRLLSLNTECRNDAEVLGVLPLLNPSLRSLNLAVHQSATDYMHELLEGIESNLPNLEHLSISYLQVSSPVPGESETEGNPASREMDPYLHFPMQSLSLPRSLKTLSVPSACACADALFNFSCLPNLEFLTFTGSWVADAHEGEWSELQLSSFPALRRLSISECSTQTASALLSIIPEAVSLSEVDIALSAADSGLGELCTTLARFRNSIRAVSMRNAGSDSSPTNIQEISEALATCLKLEGLTLNGVTEISDVQFGEFVRRLPYNCVVRIGNHSRP